MDQACVSVCPVDCIHFDEGADRTLYIDPNECIDCGACEPECPVNAIFAEDSLPAEWTGYTEINALWYTDKDAARSCRRCRQARLVANFVRNQRPARKAGRFRFPRVIRG